MAIDICLPFSIRGRSFPRSYTSTGPKKITSICSQSVFDLVLAIKKQLGAPVNDMLIKQGQQELSKLSPSGVDISKRQKTKELTEAYAANNQIAETSKSPRRHARITPLAYGRKEVDEYQRLRNDIEQLDHQGASAE